MDIDTIPMLREELEKKFKGDVKYYEEMTKAAVAKAERLGNSEPAEFEFVVEVHTYWGERESGVSIRSKGTLREAISAGIREFHVKNDRGDKINGCVRVGIEAMGVKFGIERVASEEECDALFEELNLDESLWMDLYKEYRVCDNVTQLVKKK